MYYGNLKKNFHLIRLFKKLASSAWGEIQNKKNIWKTEDDIISEKLDIGFGYDTDYHIQEIRAKPTGNEYRLINLKTNIYEYQFRLKSFLTDFGRVKIAKIALQNIDNIVRIQTDSITFDQPIKLTINNFAIDDKKLENLKSRIKK